MSTKILIVEDEIDIREGISEYLSEVGYDVMVAEDGQEGIDLFKSNEFDLVLLDIMLPKINLRKICQRSNKRYGCQNKRQMMYNKRNSPIM